jgi:hypothetical protein
VFASRHFAARHFGARHFLATGSLTATELFTRWGKLGHVLNTVNGRRGGTAAGDIPVEVNDAITAYDGEGNHVRKSVATLLTDLASLQAGMSSMCSALRKAAQTDLVQAFNYDDPLPELTVTAGLDALWRLMKGGGYYVEPNTLSSAVHSTGNSGTGAIAVHTKDPYGVPLENLLAEDLVITVTSVSTPASPRLQVRGELSQRDKLHFEWPAGSGVTASYTAIDAADATVNLLTNGAFDTFTVANTPTSWTIAVGAAGTDIFEESTTVYISGGKALKFAGTASAPLSQIYQSVVANVAAETVYGINFWCRVSDTPSEGVLVIDLHDGTSVINDDAGTAISTSIDLTTLGTTFTAKQLTFALPAPLPAIVRVRIRLSTELENGKSVYIDHMALAELEQPGSVPGATPYLGFFSGSTNWALDDGSGTRVLKIQVNNNRGSQWQELLDKFFGTAELGWTAPTSGSTLLSDSLIG